VTGESLVTTCYKAPAQNAPQLIDGWSYRLQSTNCTEIVHSWKVKGQDHKVNVMVYTEKRTRSRKKFESW